MTYENGAPLGENDLLDHDVPLQIIRIDGGTQARTAINDDIVTEYTDALRHGTVLPPLSLFFDGEHFWLADGFHRYHAYQRIGIERVSAEIRTGTRRDAVLYSVGANAGHGLRRTNEDKRKAVKTLLADAEWAGWSNTAIAKACGVSDHFVGVVRKVIIDPIDDSQSGNQLSPANLIAPAAPATRNVTRNVTRNGTTYEQKVKAKPATPPMVAAEDVEPTVAMPRLSPEHGAVAVTDVDALRAENAELRAELGELAEQLEETLTEAETMRKVIEANEPLTESVKSLKQARELNRVLETRLQGLVSEKNEILRRYNGAHHQLDRLKQAHASLDELMAENAALHEKLAAALDEMASLKTKLTNALESLEELDDLKTDLAETLDDNNMMTRVFDADDQVKAALAEVARYRAVAEHANRTLAGRAQEYNERARLVSYWKKRAEKAEKRLSNI